MFLGDESLNSLPVQVNSEFIHTKINVITNS